MSINNGLNPFAETDEFNVNMQNQVRNVTVCQCDDEFFSVQALTGKA